MGHQVNFYLAPQDLVLLETRFRKIEPMFVLHSRSLTSAPQIVESAGSIDDPKPWLYYFLVRIHELDEVVMRHVPAQGHWTVDVVSSPVVELTRSFFDGRILRRGRLYYVDSFYGANEVLVTKPLAFRGWAESLLGATRKLLMKHGRDYIDRHAHAWLSSPDNDGHPRHLDP